MQDLLKREGATFPMREKLVHLVSGEKITALVPVYEGRRVLTGKSLQEIAAMAIRAKGERGSGVQYVKDIAAHLTKAEIYDPVVIDLWTEIQRQLLEASIKLAGTEVRGKQRK